MRRWTSISVLTVSTSLSVASCGSNSEDDSWAGPTGKDAGAGGTSPDGGADSSAAGQGGAQQTGGSAGTAGAVGCATGDEQCVSGVHQVCQSGAFVDAPCGTGTSCDSKSGECVACLCTPGAAGDCADGTTLSFCRADCMGWEPTPCGSFQVCTTGACIDQICVPGTKGCADSKTWQLCNADGTAYEPGGTCTEKESCESISGCVSLCAAAAKQPSSVGCSFFALNMDNFNEANQDAVVVGNTSPTLTAVVDFLASPGGVETALESGAQIPPLGQHTFWIPNGTADVIESVSLLRKGGSFRVRSDIPVIAYQHSPVQAQATNDASCLIPESSLGNRYIVAAYTDALGAHPSYFNVVAAQDNTTVTFTVPVATQAGTGVPALQAGGSSSVVMNRYDTLQVVAPSSDVTGTEIVSTAPVAVFGAVECAQVPAGYTYCDHLEEQSIPVRNWGRKYVAAHAPKRSGSERYYWRVLGQTDATTITSDPPQTGFPITLSSGQFHEFWTQESFMLEGDKPFAAFQYVSGQNAFGAGTGDPAMITAIPVEQFLKSYVILTPTGYSQDYVQIVRTSNEQVLVDGAAVPDSEYYSVGGYTVADHVVAAGAHVLTSTGAFGIVGVGYTNVTSYGYPGGFALKDLTP